MYAGVVGSSGIVPTLDAHAEAAQTPLPGGDAEDPRLAPRRRRDSRNSHDSIDPSQQALLADAHLRTAATAAVRRVASEEATSRRRPRRSLEEMVTDVVMEIREEASHEIHVDAAYGVVQLIGSSTKDGGRPGTGSSQSASGGGGMKRSASAVELIESTLAKLQNWYVISCSPCLAISRACMHTCR